MRHYAFYHWQYPENKSYFFPKKTLSFIVRSRGRHAHAVQEIIECEAVLGSWPTREQQRDGYYRFYYQSFKKPKPPVPYGLGAARGGMPSRYNRGVWNRAVGNGVTSEELLSYEDAVWLRGGYRIAQRTYQKNGLVP